MKKGACILLAGGSGKRMKGAVKDKVLYPLIGLPVILHSFAAFVDSGTISTAVFVCRDDAQEAEISLGIKKFFPDIAVEILFARGGAERQDSVLNGLRKIDNPCDRLAFIHDGARPFVGAENIRRLSQAALLSGGAVLASRVVDTIKRVPSDMEVGKPVCLDDLERNRLWAMQTPQVFVAEKIIQAYEFVRLNKIAVTDDVAAFARCGGKTSIVENSFPNPKITSPDNIEFVEFLVSRGRVSGSKIAR